MTGIIYNIVEILINLFQSTIVMYFAYRYLGDRKNRKFSQNGGIVFSLALTIFLTIVNYIVIFENVIIIFYILFVLVYAVSQLNGKIFSKIFASAYQVICNCIIGVLTANFYAALFGETLEDMLSKDSAARMISLLSTQLIIIYIYQISIRRLKKDKENFLKRQEWMLIIIVLLISIVQAGILNLVSLHEADYIVRFMITVIVSCIILTNIVTVCLVTNLGRKNKFAQENKALKLRQNYQQKLIDKAKEEFETIRKIRHDYKNTYNLIYTLIEENKLEEAQRYIEKNIQSVEPIGTIVNTNSDIVNAIVGSKILTANNKGIKTTFMSVSNFEGIHDLDISAILGNLYNNAIEACEQCDMDNRMIHLKISENNGAYMISMKNTINKSVIKNNPELMTTKKDRDMHGLGTKIIKDHVNKYNGITDYYEENGYFCCLILLYTK